MALYTSTQTTATGTVVNAVLNSVLNTITYTVTAPNGVVAVSTQGLASPGLRDIFTQLRTGGSSDLSDEIARAINNVNASVNQQATTAQTTAEVTGEPQPQESQAIPVSPNTDPQQQAFLDANAEPETIPDPPFIDDQEADLLQIQQEEAAAINAGIPQPEVISDEEADLLEIQREESLAIVGVPEIISDEEADLLQAQGEEAAAIFEQPEIISDEEADLLQAQREEAAAIGLGEQQKQIAINTKGLPVLAEDGSVDQGVAINPESGERYSTGTSAPYSDGSSRSIDANKRSAQEQATIQDSTQFKARQDWRVRLSLSPGADYLYAVKGEKGILAPLAETRGVIFPYTPTISVTYSSTYDPSHPTHSNYKIFQYTNSSVDSISITGDFTAQDTREANYLLAVIHFFRSITKMFYGQDQNPKPGTPPPLCYLFGLGAFQFDAHPLAITNFTYSLPNDVDYIKANISYGSAGVNRSGNSNTNNTLSTSAARLGSQISVGGTIPKPTFSSTPSGSVEPTYVPTKIQLQISAIPVISRNQISNEFSFTKYATGELMRGTKRSGGGIW